MQPKRTGNTPEAREWPIIANVVVPIAEWWRRHAAIRDNLEGLDAIGADEMARVAHDVGLSPGDLRALATHCSDAADLLDRRLDALGLSVKWRAFATRGFGVRVYDFGADLELPAARKSRSYRFALYLTMKSLPREPG